MALPPPRSSVTCLFIYFFVLKEFELISHYCCDFLNLNGVMKHDFILENSTNFFSFSLGQHSYQALGSKKARACPVGLNVRFDSILWPFPKSTPSLSVPLTSPLFPLLYPHETKTRKACITDEEVLVFSLYNKKHLYSIVKCNILKTE